MTRPEILMLILIMESLLLLGIVAVVAFWIVRILQTVKSASDNVEETTNDIKGFKNKAKIFLNSFDWRGGETNMTRRKGPGGAVIAGVTGAALGAVAGVALSDRKTRDKIGQLAEGMREQGASVYHEVKKTADKKSKKSRK